MKRFIKHVLLFLLPVLCVAGYFGFFYGVGVYAGEFSDIDRSIAAQRDDHRILIGRGYNEQTTYLKLQNADYYRPKVIALGSSRAMQFRELMFSDSFYNCGGAVGGSYDEYIAFLEALNFTPEVVILDLDIWVFNEDWIAMHAENNVFLTVTQTKNNAVYLTRSIARDYRNHVWRFSDFNNYAHNIGFNGRIKDNGFLYDGAYYYGRIYRNRGDAAPDFSDVTERIETGGSRFEYGDHIYAETLQKLEDLLIYCKEHGIHVSAYLAPFPPSVYAQMQDAGQYGYIDEITPVCETLFEQYGFSYQNFTDVTALGLTDRYFVDGLHAGDVAHGYMLLQMAENDKTLRQYVDTDDLREQLDHAHSELIFEEIEIP